MLDKYRADPARDAQRLTELKPQEQRYWRLVAERKVGRTLAEQGCSSAYVEIKITDETNTRVEGLSALMPNLHHESYIHVVDVRAGAYGYGGLTQEFRAHHG